MQYCVNFDQEFDMAQIVDRISSRTAPYDNLEGLAFKAFMMQTAEEEGKNSYSSFYIWRDPAVFESFLVDGEMFAGLSKSFGRPNVALEIVLDWKRHDKISQSRYAFQSCMIISDDTDHRGISRILQSTHAVLDPIETIVTVTGDPWRISCISLLPEAPKKKIRDDLDIEGLWFKVVHMSRPQ